MKNVILFVRRSAAALIAGLVVCSANAATVPSSCNPAAAAADGLKLLKTCAPQVTFYAAGSYSAKPSILITLENTVFDRSKALVKIQLDGNTTNHYAYYGYGARGKSYAGKRLAVIINHSNTSLAGVSQLLSGLKHGSFENGVDQQEYMVMQLHTAAAEKAGQLMPDTDLISVQDYYSPDSESRFPLVTLARTRVADFKSAWGWDKQKIVHMAFSDFRPSEFPPGLITKWDSKQFPSETIAMQGYGVAVNNNMYKALMARDVREGQIHDASCDSSDASMLLAKCQPTITLADYAALIKGKTSTAAEFLRDNSETRVLNLNRLRTSQGSQIATQIMFAGQSNYIGKTPLVSDQLALVGYDSFNIPGSIVNTNSGYRTMSVSQKFNIITNASNSDVLMNLERDSTGLSIGVAYLRLLVHSPNQRWIKLDRSPDFNPDGTLDGYRRTGLQLGYSFAFEFQALKSSKLAGDYSVIYMDILNGLKDPKVNLMGFAYMNSNDGSKNTVWTRGGNNYFPLSKY